MRNGSIGSRSLFECTEEGHIVDILLDEAAIIADQAVPARVHDMIAPTSSTAFGSFWTGIRSQGAFTGQRVMAIVDGNELDLLLDGYQLKGKILICATIAVSRSVSKDASWGMDEHEGADLERGATRFEGAPRAVSDRAVMDTLDDFTRLNNELVNTKRELTRVNARTNELNIRLKEANESMETFVYSVAHDLREPVRMVSAFMERLDREYGATMDGKARTYTQFARDGALRVNTMMDDLMTYYKARDIGITGSADLNALTAEVIQLLGLVIEENEAEVVAGPLPKIEGSPAAFRQVLQNLIGNALKFRSPDRKPSIRLEAKGENGQWHITISDNGLGIPEGSLDQIFKLFKRAHGRSSEGTGLGLALVKQIVERHGGRIWAESTMGVGSTFHMVLPQDPVHHKHLGPDEN